MKFLGLGLSKDPCDASMKGSLLTVARSALISETLAMGIPFTRLLQSEVNMFFETIVFPRLSSFP